MEYACEGKVLAGVGSEQESKSVGQVEVGEAGKWL